MALRDQPYLPLYVQDYLSDEKLSLCTYSTQGIYIRIMCVLHKSDTYGGILFKQIPKQNFSSLQYFAFILSKQTGVDSSDMQDAIEELIFFDVLKIEEQNKVDFLFQKRMVKDFNISQARSESAKKGGGNPNLFKQSSKQTHKQTPKQNPEYEYEYEIEDENKDENKDEKRVTGKKEKSKKQVSELQYPFASELFIETWKILLTTPKWKKKIPHSLQLALNSLGKYNEEFSIMLMNKAIENNWQGVTYSDTDEQYQKWLNKNGNTEVRKSDSNFRQNTSGNNAEDKKRSVDRLADMAEAILQNSKSEDIQ